MSNSWKYGLIWTGLAILGVMIAVPAGMGTDGGTWFTVVFATAVTAAIAIMQSKAAKKVTQKTGDVFTYSLSAYTLNVLKRDPVFRDALSVDADRDLLVGYTPDKVLYTSATVGGVTTGGFDTIKGGYSFSQGEKKGTYSLEYKYATHTAEGYLPGAIWSIKLSPALFQEAKANDRLKRYLPSKEEKSRTKAVDFATDSALVLQGRSKSSGDCEYIIDWLCGTERENGGNKEPFVCEACGKAFTGWYQECPNCHEQGKMKKRT